MSNSPRSFFIGWDVGGWNCDRNKKSRDALVILDSRGEECGSPWRGNLRGTINEANSTSEWLEALFRLCEEEYPASASVVMAVDAPLGFSEQFLKLAGSLCPIQSIGDSHSNSYLFRQTERLLFERGCRPLSALKDMLGSQATKGMHVLAKFAPQLESCGVWTDGHGFRVIETYPSACRTYAVFSFSGGRGDEADARVCASVAHQFATRREVLEPPKDEIPTSEGWIWVPRGQ